MWRRGFQRGILVLAVFESPPLNSRACRAPAAYRLTSPAQASRSRMIRLRIHFWGVVQSVGHLTVNEDGGGSSPPAPAKPPGSHFTAGSVG